MNIFWSKYYPWIRKLIAVFILVCLALRAFTEIEFSRLVLLIVIIFYVFLEMAHFYLTTDLD